MREEADVSKARLQADIERLQQRQEVAAQARRAQQEALELELQRRKLDMQLELQVGRGGAAGPLLAALGRCCHACFTVATAPGGAAQLPHNSCRQPASTMQRAEWLRSHQHHHARHAAAPCSRCIVRHTLFAGAALGISIEWLVSAMHVVEVPCMWWRCHA